MTKTKLYARGKFHSSVRRRPRRVAKQNNHPARYPLPITPYDRQCAVTLRALCMGMQYDSHAGKR